MVIAVGGVGPPVAHLSLVLVVDLIKVLHGLDEGGVLEAILTLEAVDLMGEGLKLGVRRGNLIVAVSVDGGGLAFLLVALTLLFLGLFELEPREGGTDFLALLLALNDDVHRIFTLGISPLGSVFGTSFNHINLFNYFPM